MLKTLTNHEIYTINSQFNEAFKDCNQFIQAKINFYIQKNRKKLVELATEIEATRIEIIKNFGQQQEDGQYYIEQDKILIAQQEMQDLLDITQEVEISTISLKDIENLHFTFPQMEALMFMIEE